MSRAKLFAMILYYGITALLAAITIGLTLGFLYILTGDWRTVAMVVVGVLGVVAALFVRDTAREYLGK